MDIKLILILVAIAVIAGILFMISRKKASVEANETPETSETPSDNLYPFLGDLWEQDEETIQYHISNAIGKKSNSGEDLSKLNDYEKVFLVMDELEMEVNNGGFDQFFLNTDGRYNDILVSSAEAIKANDMAEICKKALAIYAEHAGEEDAIEELNECDEAFYASEDYITGLSVQYAKENKEQFKELVEKYVK